jgi:dihydrofolate reductase
MTVTLYNVISKDWFIAEKDGSENFIPEELWQTTLNVFSTFDTVVLGRKSYDALQSYEQVAIEAFERIPIRKIVVSSNPELKLKEGYVWAATPEQALESGESIGVTSGPTLNNYLLEKGMVDRILFH